MNDWDALDIIAAVVACMAVTCFLISGVGLYLLSRPANENREPKRRSWIPRESGW